MSLRFEVWFPGRYARFCISIAWIISKLENISVEGLGTVSSLFVRIEGMELIAAPTEADHWEAAWSKVS